jgi:hypothetical protein
MAGTIFGFGAGGRLMGVPSDVTSARLHELDIRHHPPES